MSYKYFFASLFILGAAIALATEAPQAKTDERAPSAVEPKGLADEHEKLEESQSAPNRSAENPDAETPIADPDEPYDDEPKLPPKKMGPPKGAVKLSKTDAIWIDRKKGIVIVDGRVSLREGRLEMFACPRGTKEHESVVSVESKAFLIHAALLNVKAVPGHPVQFREKYVPAEGSEIEITVQWIDDKDKKHSMRAQQWVKNTKTKKAMVHPWVFAGSAFWHDDVTGEDHYQAESGDMICVSNFSTAMLDLPVKSSASEEFLAFEAFTKNIPPLGTHVRLILKPKPGYKAKKAGKEKEGPRDKINKPEKTAAPKEQDASQ